MSAPQNKAVFLSYASQDAEAVARIAEALRAAGVEVWFDKDELVGGDAWDQKIRRQIKECALFVPVISANTNARAEGYFRLEWKLAVDRSHLMADDAPFLFPVVIDETTDAAARVPDRFREVQWTRLRPVGFGGQAPDDASLAAFCGRVGKLLGGENVARAFQAVDAAGDMGGKARATGKRGSGWMRNIGLIGGLVLGLIYAVRPMFFPAAVREKKTAAVVAPAAPATPAVSEGVKFAQRAKALYDKAGFGRDDLALAEDFAKRATEAEPTVALCWGVRAHVQAAYLFRGFAVGDEFVQRARDAQSWANRALALEANEAEALLAQGRVATYQRANAQAEEIFGRALAAHPDDNRIRRALGVMLRYQAKRLPEASSVLQEAVRRDPRDALAHYDLAMAWERGGNFPAAWAAFDTAISLRPFASALLGKAGMAIGWKGDVAALRAMVDQLAPGDRTEDRAVYYAMLCGVLERNVEGTLGAAALTPREYLEDSAFVGPKAWFPALVYQRAGKDNLARAHWQAAEAVLRERIRADPKSERYHVQLALTLAWLGRAEEAAREVAPIEAAWKEQMTYAAAREFARHYAALGDTATAMIYLRQAVNKTWLYTEQDMRLDPFLDKVRDTPEFVALLAAPPKQPAAVVPVPYQGKAPVAATAASREAEQLVAEVYAMLAKVSYTRENLAVAEEQTRKATELAHGSARAWAARARVQAAYIQRTWDVSEKRRQDGQAFATRALSLDADEADAMIAQAAVSSSQGNPAQAEVILRRAVEVRPTDPLARRLIATALWQQGRTEEALAASLETARLFPDDALAHYDLGNSYTTSRRGEPDLALRAFDAALAIEPFSSALLAKVLVLTGSKGDLTAARRTLDQLATADRSEDRAVSFAMWLGLLQRDRPRVEAAAALTARTYFEDTYFYGPKAWMVALASQRDGREATARLQWQVAETAVRARLQAKPDDLREKLRLCITLAWLGRSGEIAAEVAMIEGLARESNNPFHLYAAAQFYAALGDAPRAVPYLRRVLNFRETHTDHTLPLDPWWDKLRGQPEFEALLAEAKARVDAKK